jgi:hypothetical protein
MINLKFPSTFTINTQPYLDEYNQCYKNILMVNPIPEGPLRLFTRRIKLPRLSPFERDGPCYRVQNCGLALHSLRENNMCRSKCNLMTPDEIPELISFLSSNGYQIDTQLTNMLNKSEVKLSNSRIVCSATFYGANQPNIVYMK